MFGEATKWSFSTSVRFVWFHRVNMRPISAFWNRFVANLLRHNDCLTQQYKS